MVSCLTHGHGVGGASLVGTMLEGGEGGWEVGKGKCLGVGIRSNPTTQVIRPFLKMDRSVYSTGFSYLTFLPTVPFLCTVVKMWHMSSGPLFSTECIETTPLTGVTRLQSPLRMLCCLPFLFVHVSENQVFSQK